MKYALLLMGRSGDPDCGETGGADPSEFMAFDKEITEAGVVVGGFALDGPEFGVRVSESDGESIVTSGPSAESNDFVGGRYVIEAADIDEAIAWAKMCAGVIGGYIAIRQVADYLWSPSPRRPSGSSAPSARRIVGGCSRRWPIDSAISTSPRRPSTMPCSARSRRGPAAVCPPDPRRG